MTNEDNASIRYLMKEMDPSEEVLMERAMMEDDDLLIEVECLRQTLKRLDKLPKLDPPAHLTDSIIREAVEYRKKSRRSLRFMIPAAGFKYAAAALFVIGTTVASLMFYGENSSPASSEGSAPLSNLDPTTADTPVAAQQFQTVQTGAESPMDAEPEPWVDRNDILYFQDQYNKNNTAFQLLIKNSTEKLTPLDDMYFYNAGTRTLQLTGSGSNR
jgi:hypothetical protein